MHRYFALFSALLPAVFLVACGMPQPPANLTIDAHGIAVSTGPTLADYWSGHAEFRLDVADTGLPMGESDTITAPDGSALWSYVHASHQSLGVIDQCGDPVEFPGCMVIFESRDQGVGFQPLVQETPLIEGNSAAPVTCQMPCRACPCSSSRDHIDQQQYPRVDRFTVFHTGQATRHSPSPGLTTWLMVYEYRANVFLRRSADGLNWTTAEEVPLTGIWQNWLMPCPAHSNVGPHPFAPPAYDCLVGSPPGLFIDAPRAGTDAPEANPPVYIFVGLGQNPGAMGCYRGRLHTPAALYQRCEHTPLFVGNPDYGPEDDAGPATNPHFDFRTISSADVVRIGDEYYMLYEGVRGPSAGAAGDTQFTLGLARTIGGRIDGPWETYPGNPILLDMPGNVGVGHADILIQPAATYLYTSVDGVIRSRFVLEWRAE